MKISNRSLEKHIYGAYRTEYEKGYMSFCHYTEEQIEYFEKVSDFWWVRANYTHSVTIEVITDATEISFDYKMWERYDACDTMEVYVDGLCYGIKYLKDMPDKGRVSFDLPTGQKTVIVYFPIDRKVWIKGFELNGSVCKKVKRKKGKILWMGDSITQGFGTFRIGETYVNVANRELGYDVINQGIGGYLFDERALTPMPVCTFDKIIIAFGTNQFLNADFDEEVKKYFTKLHQLYPSVPTFVLTPIWRRGDEQMQAKLEEAREKICAVCAQYPNIKTVDGKTLISPLEEYFYDGLHPNALGGAVYGHNVATEIKNLKF